MSPSPIPAGAPAAAGGTTLPQCPDPNGLGRPAKSNAVYSYDNVGNLTSITYASSPAISLAYDPLNRLTNMVDAVGTTRYGYTSIGQLLSEGGPWANDTVTYGYNNSQSRSSLSLLQPSGDLAAKVDFSRSDLTSGRDTLSADRCQTIYDAAKSVVANLGDYDITAADVKALADAIKAYRAVLTKPREARIAGKSATDQLATEFDSADAIVSNHLDAFVPKFKKSAPEFASLYENARTIVDAVATRAPKSAPQPAPAK